MKTLLKLLFTVLLITILATAVSAEDKITVVLDPGHGGHDPGTIVGTRYESEYIDDVTALLKGYLEETGKFDVYLTRGVGEYKKYLNRALVADSVNADILISLHFNGGNYPSKNGTEVLASVLDEWYPQTLASSICSAISKNCGLANGGVVRKLDTGDDRGIYYWHDEIGWDIPGVKTNRVSDYYSMIAWGTKLGFPSIIVEHAYLSNASDLAFCDSEGAMEKMARAEADAIISYYTGHTHTYGEVTVDRRANCCLEGVSSRKCTVCGHRTDVTRTPVDSAAHGWTTTSAQVTCTTDGYVKRECQISRNLSEKGLDHLTVHTETTVTPATGHNIVTEKEWAASHGVDGYKKEVCTACGEFWEYHTPGDPHVYEVTDSLDPTCTNSGYKTYLCSVCDHTYTDESEPLGHTFASDSEEISCAHSGTVTYTCTTCSEVVTETVDVPSHTWSLADKKDATCEEDGYEKMVCNVCGATDEVILTATGHDYGDGSLTKEAGFFSDGEMTFICKNDESHVKTETVPKTAGGILPIIAATSGVVLLLCAAAFLLIRGGKKRISDVADTASEVLAEAKSDVAEEAQTEETEKELTKK